MKLRWRFHFHKIPNICKDPKLQRQLCNRWFGFSAGVKESPCSCVWHGVESWTGLLGTLNVTLTILLLCLQKWSLVSDFSHLQKLSCTSKGFPNEIVKYDWWFFFFPPWKSNSCNTCSFQKTTSCPENFPSFADQYKHSARNTIQHGDLHSTLSECFVKRRNKPHLSY